MRIIRFTILLVAYIALTIPLYGAYLEDIPMTITDPDGTQFDCYASGDEFFNRLHDENDFTIIAGEDGYYYYGETRDGLVYPTQYRVNSVDPESVGIEPRAMISTEEYQRRKDEFLAPMHQRDIRAPHTGEMNNLVVYIRFSDDSEFTLTRNHYDAKFNGMDSITLQHYFHEVSYENLNIESHHFPICPPTTNLSYQDSHPRSYYQPYHAVNNPNGYSTSEERRIREHTLLMNAIYHIEPEVPTDLVIDADGDGYVDNVSFIIRGNSGAWADLLWAHRWVLYTFDVFIHDKQVWDYTFQPENQSNESTLSHEMFHTLGAPDLYRYNNDFVPVGPWDLMASGFVHMGAHMKWKYANGNWIESIPEITSSGTYTLDPLTSSENNVYKIASMNSAVEYYVVEYRKQTGYYESNLPGSGLLVYRINPAAGNGNAQGPPDEVYIYRPGGSLTNNGAVNSAHFSANVGRTVINSETDPWPFLSNGQDGGLFIHEIGYAEDTIDFTVEFGFVPLFTTDINSGPPALEVQFTNTSFPLGDIDWIEWDLNGDGNIDSEEIHPTYLYEDIGSYDVTMRIGIANDVYEMTEESYINVHDTSDISGNVAGEWRLQYSPYTVTSDLWVNQDKSLIIHPGVEIVINDGSVFTIHGTIIADASEGEQIIFRSDNGWQGMKILSSDNDNQIINCRFTDSYRGALEISNSRVNVEQSVFYNNSSLGTGGAFEISHSDEVTLHNNIVSNNSSTQSSGPINLINSSPIISNNIIVNNDGNLAGAMIIRTDSNPLVINNTIANNSSDNSLIFVFQANATIMNSILQHDGEVITEVGSNIDITYSLVSGGYEGTGNIDSDPLFSSPSGGSGSEYDGTSALWYLQEDSPCIDAGNPDPEYNDIEDPENPGYALWPAMGTIINDMGAYGGLGFDHSVSADDEVISVQTTSSIKAYPNPFNPETNIALSLGEQDHSKPISLKIYNVRGQLVRTLIDNKTVTAEHNVVWNGMDQRGRSVSSGIYLITLDAATTRSMQKIMLLK
jgi:M6 family metalloprotease-like protein